MHFADPADPEVFARSAGDLESRMRAIESFRDFEVVQTSEREVILLIFGDTTDALDRIASEVGSPRLRENVVLLLDAPPRRYVGEPIAASPDLAGDLPGRVG
jgi:hypothetical protein